VFSYHIARIDKKCLSDSIDVELRWKVSRFDALSIIMTSAMDVDTIFPKLPDGEEIVNKYTHVSCRSSNRTIVFVTQFRLLISRKMLSCFNCTDRSAYTSIALDSIHQVYEEAARMSVLFIIISLINLLGWLSLLITGASASIDVMTGIGAAGLVISIVSKILFVITQKSQRICLSGSFGSEWLLLGKTDARALEKDIIENSYRAQYCYRIQSPLVKPIHEEHSAPYPPAPVFGRPPAPLFPKAYSVKSEKSIRRGTSGEATYETPGDF
jgi:hypothetical protein